MRYYWSLLAQADQPRVAPSVTLCATFILALPWYFSSLVRPNDAVDYDELKFFSDSGIHGISSKPITVSYMAVLRDYHEHTSSPSIAAPFRTLWMQSILGRSLTMK